MTVPPEYGGSGAGIKNEIDAMPAPHHDVESLEQLSARDPIRKPDTSVA